MRIIDKLTIIFSISQLKSYSSTTTSKASLVKWIPTPSHLWVPAPIMATTGKPKSSKQDRGPGSWPRW